MLPKTYLVWKLLAHDYKRDIKLGTQVQLIIVFASITALYLLFPN